MTDWAPSEGDWVVIVKDTPGFESDDDPHNLPIGLVTQVLVYHGDDDPPWVHVDPDRPVHLPPPRLDEGVMLYLPEIRPATPEESAQAQLTVPGGHL